MTGYVGIIKRAMIQRKSREFAGSPLGWFCCSISTEKIIIPVFINVIHLPEKIGLRISVVSYYDYKNFN